jgi:hypothetical protein
MGPAICVLGLLAPAWASMAKSPAPSPDGEVGWMPTIDISEGHESRNIGKEPIDLVWVTLKH